MKSFPKAVMLAAILAGSSALTVAAPALAKDKKAATGEPELKISEKVRAALVAAEAAYAPVQPAATALSTAVTTKQPVQQPQAALQAALAALEPAIVALEGAAKTNDETYIAQQYRYRKESLTLFAQYPVDLTARSAASARLAPFLERLIANPATPRTSTQGLMTLGDYAYDRGQLARGAREYAKAASYFEQARAAGNTDPNLNALIADVKLSGGDINGALVSIEADIAAQQAAGRPAPISTYDLVIEKLYCAKDPRVLTWEQRRVAAFPTPKNWHDAILRWGFNGRGPALDRKHEVDLFRLMRAVKALADEAEYRRYARAVLDDGLAVEAKSVLDEGIAAGKLIRTSPDVAVMLTPATAKATSAATLRTYESDAQKGNALSAEVAGNFHLGAGQHAKAAERTQLAATRGPRDRDTLMTHLGIAQALSGNKTAAKASFEAVAGSPRKEVASWWLTWLSVNP